LSSPFMAKTGISSLATSEAAASSWVERGLEAHSATEAPPALSACARTAVSVVICKQAENPQTRERLFFKKSLFDGIQHRHAFACPLNSKLPFICKSNVFYIIIHGMVSYVTLIGLNNSALGGAIKRFQYLQSLFKFFNEVCLLPGERIQFASKVPIARLFFVYGS